jgi:hypothetical protein
MTPMENTVNVWRDILRQQGGLGNVEVVDLIFQLACPTGCKTCIITGCTECSSGYYAIGLN